MSEYIYLGDRLTDNKMKGRPCSAIRRNGKCIRSRMGTMLVQFKDGPLAIVLARRLRK